MRKTHVELMITRAIVTPKADGLLDDQRDVFEKFVDPDSSIQTSKKQSERVYSQDMSWAIQLSGPSKSCSYPYMSTTLLGTAWVMEL